MVADDPHCLSYLLSFYDHLCLWEEGSPVPVLHVGWVDKLMVNLTRFTQRARRHLCLSIASDKEDNKSDIVHSPALTHSTCRSSRWTTESTDTTSETGVLNMNNIKRTRRNRSNQIDVTSNLSTPIAKNDLPKPNDDIDDVNAKPELINDYYTDGNIQSPSSVITNQDITGEMSTVVTRAQNNKSDMETDSLVQLLIMYTVLIPVEANKGSNPHIVKSCRTSVTVEIPEETSNTKISIKESYSPNTKSVQSSTHTNSMFDDIQSDADQILLDTEEQDGSPSPLMDFPNHDDLLASLVEACDHRLLNPAFLWGMEPHSPFLPANVAPEEALNRLMTVLEESKPSASIIHSSNDIISTETVVHHIFPTPPNSGSFTGSSENIIHEESTPSTTLSHTTLCTSPRVPESSVREIEKLTSTAITVPICLENQEHSTNYPVDRNNNLEITLKTSSVLPTEKHTLFPDNFDTVDGGCNNNNGDGVSSEDFDILTNIPNELMDSVASLVVDNHNHHQTNSNSPPTDFFDLLLESENNLNTTLCNQHQCEIENQEQNINFNGNNSVVNQSSTNHRTVKTMEELTVHLSLYSVKMASIIELLRAPRLNSSAIKLALTAQSQVCVRRSSSVHSNYF
ncbi:unnamed protein product [Schistosoma curassoni]|uniref:Menin n=1 Tax=Schistosoma curassoni TaxID=6186 RepID=A0A183KJJ3_9TREM|nr:unnamed protein product [Schistosoma curassoni]